MTEGLVRRPTWLRGSLLGAVSWLAPVLLSLAVTPFIYKGLGPEQYGLYALVLGFVGYSFNLNIARAVTKHIAEARADDTPERIPILFLTGVMAAVAIALLAMSTLYLVSPVYIGYAVVDEGQHAALFSGLMFGGATICVLLIGQVFTAVLQGYERLELFSAASTLTSAMTLGTSLLLVLGGYGFVEVLAGGLLVSFAATAVTGIVAVRLVDWSSGIRVEAAGVSQILAHSKHVIGYQVLGNIVLLFERTEISRQLGPEALTDYVVPMMVGINFAGFVNSLSLFVFPAVTSLRGDRVRAVALYRSVSAIVFVVCLFGVIASSIHSVTFLNLWMGPGFGERAGYAFALQMVGLGSVALGSVVFQMVEGMGKPHINLLGTLLVATATVLLMVVPVTGQSIESFALARAIGFGIWLPLIPVIEVSVFGSVQTQMWKWIIVHCTLPVAVFTVVQMYGPWLFGYGVVGFVGSLLLGTGAGLGLLVRQGFLPEIVQTLRSNK